MRKTVSAGPVPPSASRAYYLHPPVKLNGYGLSIILCTLLCASLFRGTVVMADDYDSLLQFEEGYVTVGSLQIQHHNTLGLRCDRVEAASAGTSIEMTYPVVFGSDTPYTSKLNIYFIPDGQVQDGDSRSLAIPGTSESLTWDEPTHTVTFTATAKGVYELYKDFEYDSSLEPGDGEKLIVLIHGWNPFETENPYIEEGSEWKMLADNIAAYIHGTDWEMFAYNWSADAATGSITPGIDKPADDGDGIKAHFLYGKAVSNGSQAAEIAHMHGYNHLGQYILENRPDIRKLHIIAHSAGSWMARAAAEYLNANKPDMMIHITFLDPYIPGEVTYNDFLQGTLKDDDSKLTSDKLRGIQNWSAVVKLDQYYTDGISDPYVLGTNSDIGWTQKGYTGKVVSLNPAKAHEYPVEWYADKVNNTPQTDENDEPYGWTRSIVYDTILSVEGTPSAFSVSQPFPNPFNPSTSIRYTIPDDSHVTVTVYDILGRAVSVLHDSYERSGAHTAVWNGIDGNGTPAGNGVYFYRVTAGQYSHQGKMLLMK